MDTLDPRECRRRGTSLLEVTVGIALGVVVVVAALAVLGLVSRGERAVRSRADVTDAVLAAESRLARDLAALQYDAGTLEVTVSEVSTNDGPFAGGRLEFTVLTPAGTLTPVRWSFDPVRGDLHRDQDGDPERVFALGPGALVRFARVDPGFASGAPPTLGQYHNRVIYRISVPSGTGPGLTLMGAEVLAVKASRDTFPYFNLES